jgi:ATP-dependent helicase/nuclease subunit A
VHPVLKVAARRYRNTPRGMVEIADQDRTEDHALPSLPLDYLRPIKPETGLRARWRVRRVGADRSR